MTEYDRQIVISRINRKLEIMDDREVLLEVKRELEQDDKVKEYLKNLSEINKLDKELERFSSKEDVITTVFKDSCDYHSNDKFLSTCEHDIWMYGGSVGEYYYADYSGRAYEMSVYDETNESFRYNEYYCLECNKEVDVEDWQLFEKNHFVLKNRDDLDTQKYMNLYYQALYKYTTEEAREIEISSFYENMIKSKMLFLKKK